MGSVPDFGNTDRKTPTGERNLSGLLLLSSQMEVALPDQVPGMTYQRTQTIEHGLLINSLFFAGLPAYQQADL
jgi:hypothetical protein